MYRLRRGLLYRNVTRILLPALLALFFALTYIKITEKILENVDVIQSFSEKSITNPNGCQMLNKSKQDFVFILSESIVYSNSKDYETISKPHDSSKLKKVTIFYRSLFSL
ncbi:hypothetical protein CDIK_0232 [Cucumispora dikerogammari]|nr:hypothetical protein CDIK_0232 [Cucumispora dikerogammari]